MKKYKFILILPNEIEVDSMDAIEGHMSWPNYSQADPVFYKGVFDSYSEAKKYASEFEIYKYVLNREGYDSYEDEDEPIFLSRYSMRKRQFVIISESLPEIRIVNILMLMP